MQKVQEIDGAQAARKDAVGSGASGAVPGTQTETGLATGAASRPGVGGLAAEDGAATAEYAIATLAACGFAAVLVALLKSGEVRSLLMGIITSALSMGS